MNSTLRLPYPGLRAFTREESDLFFGRESCVDMMVDRLAETRFLAVLGPSGSGKSSLVRTGLLDALDLGLLAAAGSHWKIADLHPGGQPMRKLAAALLQLQQEDALDDGEIDHLTEVLSQGPRSIIQWASSGNLPQESNLLILVDQFEELFRYGDYAQREEAEAFVSSLLESSSSPKAPIYIVITMRSEYLGACSSIAGLAEHISAGLYLTPRMDREECREAIVGPAGVVGFSIEPALVNRLLNDLSSFAPWEASEDRDLAAQLARQADQLPLMQHVLNRLWLRAQGEVTAASIELRLSEYEQIGGLSGALDAHGAEVIAGLGSSRLPSIESVFRTLVSGTSLATAVRRPCRISELIEVTGGQRDDVKAIVEAFSAPGCNFLRVSDPSLNSDAVIVDISHESLIRQWTPLRQWLEREVRDGSAWRRLISAQERYEHREGGLLTGLDYQSLAAWWSSAKPTPIWAARHGDNFESTQKFLEASAEAEEFQANAERRRQQGERRRMQMGIAGLAAVLAIVSGLGLWAWQETKKSSAALQSLRESTHNLETTNKKLEDARHISEETSQQRDNALHNALEQKSQADAAKASAETAKAGAEQDARRLTSALDEVSNIINSDRYGHLVGVGKIQKDLMAAIQKYQSDIEKQHRNVVGGSSIVRDDYRSALASGAVGDALKERDLLKKGYEDGINAIESTPAGKQPSDSLLADFLNDGYIYVWFLSDVGETEEAWQTLQAIEDVAKKYPPKPDSVTLLIASARIESLESRRYNEQHLSDLGTKHARKAVELGLAAMKLPDADMETMWFGFREYLNLALDTSGTEQESLRKQACQLADDLYSKAPLDERSLKAHIECLELEAGRHNSDGDKDGAIKTYQLAEETADRGIKIDPNDQQLLLLMAELENSLGYLSQGQGQEKILYQHRINATNYFVRAIRGRTVFQSDPTELRRIYGDCKSVTFPDTSTELLFYKDIIAALTPTLNAFPKAPSFAYIAADSSIHIGELVAKQPDQATVAEAYLSKSIALYNKSGVMRDLSTFSEDFYAYCGAYQQRAALYGTTHRLDLMVADMDKMKNACAPVLEKYPWDFYLRWQFIDAQKDAGLALFEAQRYREALPYLEYASHWVNAESTKLLAKMYHDGLGVEKNQDEAKKLEDLATGQKMERFTIPTDFGGVKAPFYIYVLDWPADYPYEGIDDQVIWLKEARGGTFPPEVIESFHKLVKIAKDNKVSFRELAVYALGTASDEDKKKTAAASTAGTSSDSAKKNEAPVSTNKEAQAEYERAVSLAAGGKWEEAAQAVEQALEKDPNSAGILGSAEYIYHEKLFRYDRAYELSARQVKLGSGNEDFVENHLTTGRFETCSEMAAKMRSEHPEKRIELVMTSLQFACLSGAKKSDAALEAGAQLRTQLTGLQKTGWTFTGTEHFVSSSPAFSPKGEDWVSLFEALREGDEAKAGAALTALGVP